MLKTHLSHVRTSLTNGYAEYEQQTLYVYGASVVTLAM